MKVSQNVASVTFVFAALLGASLLLLCPSSAHAQGGVPLWTNRYSFASGGSSAAAIAVDGNGNVS